MERVSKQARTRVSFGIALLSLLLGATAPPLPAQLAITEVMSSASINLGTNVVPQRADFWELTNFGTNTIDLTDCRFSDSAGLLGAEAAMFNGVSIRPGESIIFFQETAVVCTNAEQFRAWWGETNLPPGLQIYSYTGHGFSSVSDAVQLWRVTATSTTLVQRVELYAARRGFTFTYDPTTGELDRLSALGEDRAFKAVETDDIGSPGFTIGPAPLAITQQPQSLEVDAGTPATFSVQATGLPKPRFQWRFNATNMPGETSSTFTIPAALPSDAGTYTVELDNGVETVGSAPATLRVNTNPTPARIVVPPADLAVTTNQTAPFSVTTRGYPLPTFQWQWNGTNIPGATNATWNVANANYGSAGTYCVRVQNPLGATNACAVLTVGPKPYLVITEMMGGHSTNTTVRGHGDWWEVTNGDTNAVNVTRYRFDDFPGDLKNALVITNAVIMEPGAVFVTNQVIIQPGESVLFLSGTTAEAFACWWGERNLPERVQFVCYAGNGIQAAGDSMTLWNATATDPNDFIARAEYVNLNDDFSPRRGVSLTFWCDGWIEFGQPSVLGECGAIRAVEADDIGSPGFITNHPPRTVAPRPPRCLRVSRDAQGVHLTWSTQCEKRYELQYKDDLTEPNWTPLSEHSPSGPQTTTTDAVAAGWPQRFYRLRVLPDSP